MATKKLGDWPSDRPVQRQSPRLIEKRKNNPDPEIVLWICDSLPRFLDFDGHQQRNRYRPNLNWPLRNVPANKKWTVFTLPHVTILLVTFGGWDPETHLIPREMNSDIHELLNGRPKTMVKQVWISGGINHLRGHCFPNTPQDSDARARVVAAALALVFRNLATDFPRAALRFLGVGRMPVGFDVEGSTIAESIEMNRAADLVFDLIDDTFEELVRTADSHIFFSRGGPGFATAFNIFRNWNDNMIFDQYGHPNDRGHANMVFNLFMGPGCSCLAQRQFTFLG